jgi:hypothetical protein
MPNGGTIICNFVSNSTVYMKQLAILFFLFLIKFNVSSAQQLCMEPRTNDDAIIKDIVEKDGIYYITVDVVQIIENDIGAVGIKNENPKLRTFLIDPETEWHFCVPEQATIKVRDLIKKRDWFIDTFMNYSAKEGRITESTHFSCAG